MQNTTKVRNQTKLISTTDQERFERELNAFCDEKGASPSQYAPGVFATQFSTTSVSDGAMITTVYSALVFYREIVE